MPYLFQKAERQAAIDAANNRDPALDLGISSSGHTSVTKAAAEKAKENAPLDLTGDGADMLFHIDVAFCRGGHLWCSASFDTVNVYETLAAFGCARSVAVAVAESQR